MNISNNPALIATFILCVSFHVSCPRPKIKFSRVKETMTNFPPFRAIRDRFKSRGKLTVEQLTSQEANAVEQLTASEAEVAERLQTDQEPSLATEEEISEAMANFKGPPPKSSCLKTHEGIVRNGLYNAETENHIIAPNMFVFELLRAYDETPDTPEDRYWLVSSCCLQLVEKPKTDGSAVCTLICLTPDLTSSTAPSISRILAASKKDVGSSATSVSQEKALDLSTGEESIYQGDDTSRAIYKHSVGENVGASSHEPEYQGSADRVVSMHEFYQEKSMR
ncbi:hypothetical protein RF11_07009 [Thelohanellus kitauei]|uniref:Uncharacterized protein n=1 Tax=Thelohanellus kitauei TaxID=669202 RepID=A0A0C2MV06_THEKT|nr:hypothetical protein RF11_07009 [Thelohanellus kitauei]